MLDCHRGRKQRKQHNSQQHNHHTKQPFNNIQKPALWPVFVTHHGTMICAHNQNRANNSDRMDVLLKNLAQVVLAMAKAVQAAALVALFVDAG